MLTFISFILLLAITMISRAKRLLFFSNLSIFLGVWALLLVLYSFNLSAFPPLSSMLVFFFMVFFLVYIFSYFLMASSFRKVSEEKMFRVYYNVCDEQIRKRLAFGVKSVFLFWAIFFFIFVRTIQESTGLLNYLFSGGARLALSEVQGVSVQYYVFAYTFVVFATLLLSQLKGSERLMVSGATIIILLSLLLTAAKVNFVSGVFIFYILWFNQRKFGLSKFLRHAILLLVLGYAFIFSYSIFTGKIVDQSVQSVNSLTDILNYGRSGFLYPYDYFAGSLAALDYNFHSIQSQPSQSLWGTYSFYSVYKILNALSIITSAEVLPDKLYGFVQFGHVSTNVYTFFNDILIDFGFFGALLCAPLIGALHAVLDLSERRSKNVALILLSNVSKLSAFLSFVNFRYGDTLFVFALSIWIISLLIISINRHSDVFRYQ